MTDFITKSREAAAQGDTFSSYRLMVSAVDADPENAAAWYGLGCALQDFKKYAAASAVFSRAARLHPGDHKTLVNLGINLGLVGRYYEARDALSKAVKLDPDKAAGHANLANVLATMGDLSSTASARRAVECEPDMPLAHMQYAFDLLRDGDLLEGFREYEWRFKYKLSEFLSYPYPIWRGEETGTLMIVAEQGLGDNIQMMRFIPAAAKRPDRVLWFCHKEMVSLAQTFVDANVGRPATGPVEIVPMPSPIPPADAFIPTMSLPVALGVTKIEAGRPYISFRHTPKIDPNYRVGLAWAGSPDHDNAKYRDASLEALLPLTEISAVDFYSLQVGPGRGQLDELGAHGLIHDLSGLITNLADTAREIAHLDLVITIDTAVAHLAGAMGKECWMLVNQRARDWRWGRSGKTTPWYPSIKIWERSLDEDTWANCVNRVKAALEERMSGEP